MSSGIKGLRRIQLAKETSHAANATATVRYIGTLSMKQEQKYYRPEDYETGKLSSYEQSYPVHEQAKLTLESDVTFQQIGYIFGMGVKGGVTGGSPSDSLYTYTYTPNLTSANNPDSYSIQYGDDIQAFTSPFCFATDFEISGTIDELVKVKANIVGQSVRTTTFTSLSNPTTIVPIPTATGKLYIDTSWATLGNTNVSATLIDFSYKVSNGYDPIKYADGAIHFTDFTEKKRHVELDVTYAFTSGVAGYYANYFAQPQTKQWIRIGFVGPLVGATAHDELDLDGCFVIDDYDTLTDRSGQDIVKLKLVSIYDSTGSNEFQVINKVNLAALT